MGNKLLLTGAGRFFQGDELSVRKTNLKVHLTWCHNIFLRVCDYTKDECPGRPHTIIRHPNMSCCVFQKLWGDIQSGCEIFAYVLNKTKLGDHYWVLAHVAPSQNNQVTNLDTYRTGREK